MTSKKEKFKQATIFDQMRFNARDEVDAAQREYDSEKVALDECSDYTKVTEYEADVILAQKKLNKANDHYAQVIKDIKEFEK
ncbi:MAG: hypothetical protein KBS86_00535 [Proteobacteria bacterium]|nr:hypothetical protein [Candidatus Enterousia scatequi]